MLALIIYFLQAGHVSRLNYARQDHKNRHHKKFMSFYIIFISTLILIKKSIFYMIEKPER